MRTPFVDLKAQYASIREEIHEAMERVLESSTFSGGPFVERFEDEFARFCGCGYAIGVGSGTDALLLILRALGIGAGDEVITVPATFAATAEAILLAGATPVFVDIDEQTYTMDPSRIGAAVTPRTRAIIPVHLFGQMADMDRIADIAGAYGLALIEDACQAHGAACRGRKAGSLGDAAAFSFYPGKNLGAYGEAGAVTTNSRELAEKIRMMRDHGQSRKYFHDMLGWNSRMDGIQAAVLSVKLRHLGRWNGLRRGKAALYSRRLAPVDGVITPWEAPYAAHVWHLYAVRVKERDRILSALHDRGISCGIHYPVPLHLQKVFSDPRYPRGSFPVSEQCADEFLSLPLYPELGEDAMESICSNLAETLRVPLAV